MADKKTIALIGVPALLLAIAAGQSVAKEITFTSLKQEKPVTIQMPAMTDSVDGGKKDYDKTSLLAARRAADRFHRYDTYNWTTLLPDTAGRMTLTPRPEKAPEGADFYVLSTRIRPDRYVKGKLVAESESMLEVFAGGKSVLKKAAADSVAAEEKGDLALEPQVTTEIEVHLVSMPDRKGAPTLKLRFIPDSDFEDVEIAEGPSTTRRFSIATTTEGEKVTGTTLSPHGRYVIVSHTEVYGQNDSRSWSELLETANNRIVSPSLPEGARWMPSGATLCYTQRKNDGKDLYVMPANTLKPQLLAANVPVSSAEMMWAPDASWFAYYDSEEGKKEEGVMRRITNPDDRIPGNRDRNYLKKYDMQSGVSSALTWGGPTTYLLDISPDSKKALYSVSRETPDHYPFYSSQLVELDVATLRTDTLLRDMGSFNGASYSPDGKQLLLIGGPEEFGGIGRNAGNHEIANSFDAQAFIMNLDGGEIKAMTRDFNPAIVGNPVWVKGDGNIYFRAEDGFYVRLYQLNPRTGKITALPVKTEYVAGFSMGNDENKYLTYTGNGYTYIGQAWSMALPSGKNTLIADPMGKEMADLNLGKEESWTFTSKRGDVIDGTLTLPPDFDATKKYPLIVYYYGGTSPSNRTMHHPYTPQLFASRGYVVYVLNPSGTTGYGQEFSARHVNAWGDYTADEIIEGVKKMCETHDFIDSKKIGCLGASYGGFMTQLLQTKTDIFAAAVSHAGISNVTSYWGEGFWGYSYNSVAAAKSYPWSNPDLFTKHGSLFNADKIHTPLLLLHGTRDTNVPIGESIQLFNALKVLGRQVEFITVEDQDHVITDYNKRQLWHATIMAWFAKWLQDDPRWWDSMYGK